MEKINDLQELREAIRNAENRRAAEWADLKTEAKILSGQLQPANLAKRMLKDLVSTPPDKELMDRGIGIAVGYVVKMLFTTGSRNPFTQLAGKVLENVVASQVTQHPAGIKAIGSLLLKKLFAQFSREKTGE